MFVRAPYRVNILKIIQKSLKIHEREPERELLIRSRSKTKEELDFLRHIGFTQESVNDEGEKILINKKPSLAILQRAITIAGWLDDQPLMLE
jgi:hypothetical protein